MVDPWSDVCMAAFAGIFTSLLVIWAPDRASTLFRLAFFGSYIGSLVWGGKTMVKIYRGEDVSGSW